MRLYLAYIYYLYRISIRLIVYYLIEELAKAGVFNIRNSDFAKVRYIRL